MIRILQCVNDMQRAGLETMLMNYFRHIDRQEICFDFLMHRAESSAYDGEIEALGGRIYRAPRLYPQNYPAYFRYMSRFFREHPEYSLIHSHIDAMSYLPLLAAKRAGLPLRIAHSHSAGIDRGPKRPVKLVFRRLLPTVATHRAAVGKRAGDFLFPGMSYDLLPNAVDPGRFCYDPRVRDSVRKSLGLGGVPVIGHVGRFTEVKNHGFLLEVFAELLKLRPEAHLMLVGSGALEDAVKARASDMGLSSRLLFLGSRSDVNELYQAMDLFVMPSLFEGVPGAAIEAQYAGLPCLLSDRITDEIAFTESCRYLPLEAGPARWAEAISNALDTGLPRAGVDEPRYDIVAAARQLENYYMALLRECDLPGERQ